MTVLRYGAIDLWPGTLRTDSQRQRSPFEASWAKTLDLLDRECFQLGASRVTIRLAVPESAIYRDGSGVKSDRKPPEHPGVIVVVETAKHGVLTYATDRFHGGRRSESWRSNVRAIALAMEALRKVERYGVADRGEQYAGFGAIGSGIVVGQAAPLTLEEAAALLAGAWTEGHVTAADVLAREEAARSSYRRAVRLLHPDHGGSGDGEKMARLNEAWRLLQEHHRGAA